MTDNIYNIGDRRRPPAPERPLSQTVNDAIHELRSFIETRIAMLRSEMREKIANVKFAAPLLIAGGLFVVTAWLLLIGAIVAALAVSFAGTSYAVFISLLIVGVVLAIVGGCALWMAYGRIRRGLVPERTINVLREDKVWLQNETRKSQL